MAEATLTQPGSTVDWTADAAYSAGAVIQLPDGRAGVVSVDVASGAVVGVNVDGIYTVAKTLTMVLLEGGRAYWDHSANKAHYKKVNDRDLYMGRVVEDAASAATTCKVALNANPPDDIDLSRDPALSVIAGTAAAAGFGYPVRLGGASILELTATNEAQKVDLLSADGFALGAKAIAEFQFRVLSDGGSGAQDLSVAVASGTHTTDFESVAEFVGVHLDGNDVNIYIESDDGTTDVAPVDSTIDYTEGVAVAQRVEVWIDMRDTSDVQVYVNGVLVLGATTFTLAAAAGPLFLIAHLEKTATTDVYKVAIDAARVRYAQAR